MTVEQRAELDRPTRCPYCGSSVSLTDSANVYQGRDYGLVYLCDRYTAKERR
jgi:hypothetical protein